MDKYDQNHNDWDSSAEIIKSDKLLQSVRDGSSSGVKYLLEQGEDPNTVDEVCFLLLFYQLIFDGPLKPSYYSLSPGW